MPGTKEVKKKVAKKAAKGALRTMAGNCCHFCKKKRNSEKKAASVETLFKKSYGFYKAEGGSLKAAEGKNEEAAMVVCTWQGHGCRLQRRQLR